MLEYDPDKPLDLPSLSETVNALKSGMIITQVILSDPDKEEGTGATFYAMTPALPRPGDLIRLEDGNVCQTQTVFSTAETKRDEHGRAAIVMLHPAAMAVLRGNEGDLYLG
jgi:hypothetical protein